MQNYIYWATDETESIEHFGILGMKWGVRRYQNEDGTLTAAGRKRYLKNPYDKNSEELNARGQAVLNTWQKMHSDVTRNLKMKGRAELEKNKEYQDASNKQHEYYKKRSELTDPIDTELTDAYYNIRKDPRYTEDQVAQIVNPDPKSSAFKNYFGKDFINKHQDTLNKISSLDDQYASNEAKIRDILNRVDANVTTKIGDVPSKITDISVSKLEKMYAIDPNTVLDYVSKNNLDSRSVSKIGKPRSYAIF